MSELVSALTQAAAEADWAAHNAAVLKVVRQSGGLDEKRRSISRARSAAVVAAVLETLATVPSAALGPDQLRGLASDVREER